MAILSTRVTDYIGSFADSTALTDMANEVARDVINMVPFEKMSFFAVEDTFTSTAVASESKALSATKIFNVRLVDSGSVERPCREISPALAGRASDSSEMIYATETDPIFYIKDSKINALPASKSVKFSKLSYPTVDLSQTAIAGFPDEGEHVIVLGTAAKALFRMMSDEIDISQGLSLSLVVYPAMPSIPSIPTISNLSISASNLVSPESPVDITIDSVVVGSLGTAPTYQKPIISLTSVPTIDDLSISLANLVSPESPIDITVDSVTVGSLGTAPTYTKPVVSLTSIPSISSLSISSVTPISPVAPSFTYTDVSAQTTSAQSYVTGSAPIYSSQNITLTGIPTIVAFVEPSLPVEPVAPSFIYETFSESTSSPTSVAALSVSAPSYVKPVFNAPAFPSLNTLQSFLPTAPASIVDASLTYTAPTVTGDGAELTSVSILDTEDTIDVQADQIEFDQWWSTLAHLIEDEEDSELANLQVSKISTYLTAYSAQMTNSLNEYNKGLAEHQQKAGKYSADISKYQAEVSSAVQRWQNDEMQSKWNKWASEYTNLLSEYTSNMVNENNRIQSNNIEYQKDLQVKLENARYTQEQLQADANRQQGTRDANAQRSYQQQVDEYSQNLQKYSASLTSYNSELSKSTQKFQLDFQKEFEVYRQENADKLSKYGLDINNALNEYNRQMSEYQAVNQKNLSNANFAQEQVQRDADRVQSAESENKLRQYQKEVEEYSGNMTSFQAQLNRYSQEVNKEVSEFQQNLNKSIQLYQAETSNQLSQYNTDIQNELNDFNKENVLYQSTVQKALQDAQIAQSKAEGDARYKLDKYVQKINKYSADVSYYSQQVNKEASEFQQNLGKVMQLYQTETANQLSQYSSDMQNSLNDFNEENVLYQSTVQKSLQDAQIAQAKADGDARHKLDKYIQKINKYNSEVSYYGQQVNKEVSEFTNNMRKEIDLYNAESQNILAKHQSNIAGVADENAKKLTEYTSRIGASTQTLGELRNQYQIISLEYNKSVAALLGITSSEKGR